MTCQCVVLALDCDLTFLTGFFVLIYSIEPLFLAESLQDEYVHQPGLGQALCFVNSRI